MQLLRFRFSGKGIGFRVEGWEGFCNSNGVRKVHRISGQVYKRFISFMMKERCIRD